MERGLRTCAGMTKEFLVRSSGESPGYPALRLAGKGAWAAMHVLFKDRSKVRRIAEAGTIGHFGHVQPRIEQQPAGDFQALANEVYLKRMARRAAVYPPKVPGRDLQMTGNFLNRDRLRAKLMY